MELLIKPRSKRKQVFLDPWREQLLERFAEKSGKTESAVIREALDRYLPGPKKPVSFWELAEKIASMPGKKAPADLSTRHDHYYAVDEFKRWRRK